jgi:hypothetical protein
LWLVILCSIKYAQSFGICRVHTIWNHLPPPSQVTQTPTGYNSNESNDFSLWYRLCLCGMALPS